ASLDSNYGLAVSQISFMPLGADTNTAVYHAVTENDIAYFVKLRNGNFDETAATLPKFLSDQGIPNVIPPLITKSGQLWACLDTFKILLYPFVEGRDGFNIDLSDQHWFELGKALNRIHTANVPRSITSQIQTETYPPRWREIVKACLRRIETEMFSDLVAAELVLFLKRNRDEIHYLVGRAEHLAAVLQNDLLPFTVCHSDIHAGNILIDSKDGLFIVDWDNPIIAPKERDLMFIGGAQGFTGHTLEEEETLFYRGYGQIHVDRTALAYYRYERIVQDLAAYCEQLLSTNEGGEDREQSLQYLKSNFLPGNTIETAYKSDKTLRE
ncbi:MAG TPA: aminoglycoside phosphotransferase family protein, partial [Anaerolineales bacterium]|nr:aminoglycoside phosphotransferase family protein [Anaerolineales bacterium]